MAVIPTAVMERIRSRAEEAYPEECCGFLTGVREGGAAPPTVRVVAEIPTENAAPEGDRRREFRVEPKALLDVMKTYRDRDEDVVGFYHSHPDHEADLSPTDLEFARLWPRTVWVIVPVKEGEAGQERAWWLPGTGAGRAGSPGIDVGQKPEKNDALLETAQEMIIRSSASAERAVTPREEKV